MTQNIHPTAYIHPAAIVEDGATIGARTKVWAFTHILPGAVIGEDCNINDHVFIENKVVVGNNVTVKSGVQLWDGVEIEDNVFVGPNACFTNDPFPRSKHHLKSYPKTTIRRNASIGANATILPGRNIGGNAMVGAGAVVTKDVPPQAIVVGNPAAIMGYVDTGIVESDSSRSDYRSTNEVAVKGVTLVNLPEIVDMRGSLSFAEIEGGLPFQPERYFLIYNVPNRKIRGEHAHRTLQEFLVCVVGSVSVVVDDGINRQEIRLSQPNIGLHVMPMVWLIQYKYSEDAILLVLASNKYDSSEYIRDYSEFLKLTTSKMK